MPQANGVPPPATATLSHLSDYPVINDSITYFRQNPYGQKSIELGDSAYQALVKNLFPYLEKPFEYVSPYVRKADALGDNALSKIDERLPVLKKPTEELLAEGKAIIFYPINQGLKTKGHVVDVYNSEYKKVQGYGLVKSGKALVSAGLLLTSETLNWVGDVIRAASVEAKETANGAPPAQD